MTISSTPVSRRCRLATIFGSKLESRSRGTEISTGPVSARGRVRRRCCSRTFTPDHSGSARELARIWDLPVWVHPGEMPLAAGRYRPEYGNPLDRWLVVPLMHVLPRRRVDSMICEASLAGVARPLDPVGPPPGLPDWRCVAAPGHTPGHAAFFRARDRVLISGDAVLTVNLNSVRGLRRGKPGVWGPPLYTTWNWPLAKESVAALARLEPHVLAGGHGRPMTGAGTAACLHALAEKLRGATGAAGRGGQRHPAARTADQGPHSPRRD
jgi:glyoxylase-like metal-dependent hydrolase (beta-lactamase superfamily II)